MGLLITPLLILKYYPSMQISPPTLSDPFWIKALRFWWKPVKIAHQKLALELIGPNSLRSLKTLLAKNNQKAKGFKMCTIMIGLWDKFLIHIIKISFKAQICKLLKHFQRFTNGINQDLNNFQKPTWNLEHFQNNLEVENKWKKFITTSLYSQKETNQKIISLKWVK